MYVQLVALFNILWFNTVPPIALSLRCCLRFPQCIALLSVLGCTRVSYNLASTLYYPLRIYELNERVSAHSLD